MAYAPARAALHEAAWLAADAFARCSAEATSGATEEQFKAALSVGWVGRGRRGRCKRDGEGDVVVLCTGTGIVVVISGQARPSSRGGAAKGSDCAVGAGGWCWLARRAKAQVLCRLPASGTCWSGWH